MSPGGGSGPSVTFHLVPEPVWRRHADAQEYLPEGFAEEGFVHCTNGEELVIEVANRFYRDDPRPYVLLDVELSKLAAPVVYEDAEKTYPHVYGAIERAAVRRVRSVVRADDGSFSCVGAVVA